MKQAIQSGDVVRDAWPAEMAKHVNLYLGSGRCGACFDAWGLMNNGARGETPASQSATVLMHADHWHRGKFGLDYWLPVARLMWAGSPPAPPTRYRQYQALYDGRLRTEYAAAGLRYDLTSFFHPDRRDLLAMDLQYESSADAPMPDWLLTPETTLRVHYQQELSGTVENLTLDSAAGFWLCRVRAGTAECVVALRVISQDEPPTLSADPRGLRIGFNGRRGRHLLLIGIAAAARQAELVEEMHSVASPDRYAFEAGEAWHRRFGDACVRLPVPQYQALWARSLAYTLASYAPEVRSPAPPMGWTGNGWPFNFPQDLSYIHPALLRLGHLDIAKSWVEFYRRTLEDQRAVTRRIYDAQGVMWAWEYPIGLGSDMLADGTPNSFQYEIHNAAYPARMARETAQYLRDPQWAREVAWPVVLESARFLASICQREADGFWSIHVVPSMGQDEMGGPNQKNYLCALFSAQYCFQAALAMARELEIPGIAGELDRWRTILRDGLAYRRLLDPALGYCVTCEGILGADQIGKQKHPVQLNPLTFLPLGEVPDHVRRAYQRRRDLCAGVRQDTYYGWTLGAFWLAASHLGDAPALFDELSQALPGRYVDPDWIQIYETSGAIGPFYVTTHGLFMQAIHDAMLSDYWGDLRIGAACPPQWPDVSFVNLRTADGCTRSGHRRGGTWKTWM